MDTTEDQTAAVPEVPAADPAPAIQPVARRTLDQSRDYAINSPAHNGAFFEQDNIGFDAHGEEVIDVPDNDEDDEILLPNRRTDLARDELVAFHTNRLKKMLREAAEAPEWVDRDQAIAWLVGETA